MDHSSIIWLERIIDNHKIEDIIENIKVKHGKEDIQGEWTILAMGNGSEDVKTILNKEEGERRPYLCVHPIEFLVKVFRKHCSKMPPFCPSIYGLTDQLLALQLVMAQRNKIETGHFEADLQDVIETHQQIIENKLKGPPCSHKDILDEYDKFLTHCNAMDYADLISSVKDCLNSDTNVKDIYQRKQYIINGSPTSIYEIEILSLLLGQRTVLKFSSNKESCSLSAEKFTEIINQSTSEANIQPIPFMPSTPSNRKPTGYSPRTPQQLTRLLLSPLLSQSPMLSQSTLSQGRIMMDHGLSILMSYLQLLVNSRDELALARVINTPCRELDIRQFNKIKQLAREKNMSMFQMVTSFILQIRLGGKSYAPSSENPLHFMTKGLGEFVSFFQKLQNTIEEIDNPKAAVLKIISTLQSTLLKSKEEALQPNDVCKASNFLKTQMENVCNDTADMPVAENKSCMLGLKTYVLLCKILDKNIMHDYEEKELRCVLKTPRRIQGKISSLISKFRTPEALTPKMVAAEETQDESKDLRKCKIKSTIEITSKRTSIWQEVEVVEPLSSQPQTVLTPVSRKRPLEEPCGTLKNNTCSPLRKRPHESIEGQDNTVPTDLKGTKEKCTTDLKGTKEKCTVKRGLLVNGKEKEREKKRNTQKKKSKPVKILKGQQQLTCFFR